MPQVTTISIFNFESSKFWAFKQMRLALPSLSKVPGLQFYKVLGCGGGNGFSIWPDFGTYALLLVWESEEDVDRFVKDDPLYAQYVANSIRNQMLYMNAIEGHGGWGGLNPFVFRPNEGNYSPMAVITRARISIRKLHHFWQYVPTVSRSMEQAPGLRFALGIGELPLIEQATFSLWNSQEDMKNYAYTMKNHREVVHQTRKKNWYKEEMFVRFHPYRSEGSITSLEL